MERRLKVGGIVGIDDIEMPSVRMLHDFLETEEEWALVEIIGCTSFFRRLRETVVVNDCHGQRINRTVRDRPSAGGSLATVVLTASKRPTEAQEFLAEAHRFSLLGLAGALLLVANPIAAFATLISAI